MYAHSSTTRALRSLSRFRSARSSSLATGKCVRRDSSSCSSRVRKGHSRSSPVFDGDGPAAFAGPSESLPAPWEHPASTSAIAAPTAITAAARYTGETLRPSRAVTSTVSSGEGVAEGTGRSKPDRFTVPFPSALLTVIRTGYGVPSAET